MDEGAVGEDGEFESGVSEHECGEVIMSNKRPEAYLPPLFGRGDLVLMLAVLGVVAFVEGPEKFLKYAEGILLGALLLVFLRGTKLLLARSKSKK